MVFFQVAALARVTGWLEASTSGISAMMQASQWPFTLEAFACIAACTAGRPEKPGASRKEGI